MLDPVKKLLDINDFEIQEKLYEGSPSIIFRAITKKNVPCILKTLNPNEINSSNLLLLKHEFEIQKGIDVAAAVKAYDFIERGDIVCFSMEDFGGKSLVQLNCFFDRSIEQKLELSINLASAIDDLHKQDITHKDICPANVLYSEQSQQVKLIDFSTASQFASIRQKFNVYQKIESTLEYVSPEQTGRINSLVDKRSDYYSLGIVLYEIFTGKKPFDTHDPVELIYQHIVKLPPAAHDINAAIPKVVSEIIHKLIEKNMEDRYQSMYALIDDLKACLEKQRGENAVSSFPIARNDISESLVIPQNLFGREKQIDQLMKSFHHVANGATELILVDGYSGVGKSSLIDEIRKPILEYKGYYISGKYQSIKSDIPYSAIAEAMNTFCHNILMESESSLSVWREQILAAIGKNGRVLTDVFPRLENIIGAQPEVPELTPEETENRFNKVFMKLISSISTEQHPLVFFIDDLQWADLATLKIFRMIMESPDMNYLMVIAAYRSNEVDSGHPAWFAINQIKKSGATVKPIHLENLSLEHINQLLSAIVSGTSEVEQLVNLIYKKTAGNAFFTIEFIKSLYQEAQLFFDTETRQWCWDSKSIATMDITDNVVDLLLFKLKKQSPTAMKSIFVGSCIGNEFYINQLALVVGLSRAEVMESIHPLIDKGLLVPLDTHYEHISDDNVTDTKLKFSHDRVHQAAYSLMSDEFKSSTHLKLARSYREQAKVDRSSANTFNIVNQYAAALTLLVDPVEQLEFIEICTEAGSIAIKSTAYRAAVNYFHLAKEMLPNNHWDQQYALTLELFNGLLSAEYLLTNYDTAGLIIDEVVEQTKCIEDRILAYEIKISLLLAQGKYREAIDLGLKVLDCLNVHLLEATELHCVPEDLLDLEEMQDPVILISFRIFSFVAVATLGVDPSLLPRVTSTMIHLSIKHGRSPQLQVGCIWHAMYLCSDYRQRALAYRYGTLAMSLAKESDNSSARCQVEHLFNAFVRHWHESGMESVKSYPSIIQMSLDTGVNMYCGYSAYTMAHNAHIMGLDLDSLMQEQQDLYKVQQGISQKFGFMSTASCLQLTQHLRAENAQPGSFTGGYFTDENDAEIPTDGLANMITFVNHTVKAEFYYWFGQYDKAANIALANEANSSALSSHLCYTQFKFFHALALVKQYPGLASEEQSDYLKRIEKDIIDFGHYANNIEINFKHRHSLLKAESYALQGDAQQAIHAYREAITLALKYHYIHDAALASELFGDYFEQLGLDDTAIHYYTKAINYYERWGAKAKVIQLSEKLAQSYSVTTVQDMSPETSSSPVSAEALSNQSLDVLSLIRATQTLSGETKLDTLLSQLCKVMVENVGGDRAVFLSIEEEQWVVAAEYQTWDEQTIHMVGTVLTDHVDSNYLPQSIFYLVSRTGESLIVEDNDLENIAYFKKNHIRSALCLPISSPSKPIGILYVENHVSGNVFTKDRIYLLDILARQAAISIENAKLYRMQEDYSHYLEQAVEERTQELKQTQEKMIEQEKMASLGNLVAGVAHEINTPLGISVTAISCIQEMLAELTPSVADNSFSQSDIQGFLEDATEGVSISSRALQQASELIESFKMIAADQASELSNEIVLSEYLHSSILALSPRLKGTKHEITISGPEDLVITTYPGVYSQIINNFVLNSITHAYKKGENGKIKIHFDVISDTLRLTYSDDGKGISQDNMKRLFEPFFTTNRSDGGTGLGTHIVYNLVVQTLKGEIKAVCPPEGGLSYEIIVPLELPELSV